MGDRRLLKGAEGFAVVAHDYERSRPSYPLAAIKHVVDRVGARPVARACDVGAGTGKLTRMLAAEGLSVVAVEPSPEMRAVLESEIPSITVVDAAAEALPFPDQDFDLVTIAQAFHWLRPVEALAEIRRVLRPGGALAIVDNDLDDRVDWVKELARIPWPQGAPLPAANPDRVTTLSDAGYVDIDMTQIHWTEPATGESLAARVRSSSTVAMQPEPAQQALVDQVLALIAGIGEPFDLPYVTDILCCRRGQ